MEKIKLDDIMNFKFLSGVKHSPDGKNICYVQYQPVLEADKYNSNLWIQSLETRDEYQLTSYGDARSFLWLDDENILFASVRDEKDLADKGDGAEFTQYYSINIHHGEAVKVFRLPMQVEKIKKLIPGQFLFSAAVKLGEPDTFLMTEEQKKERIERRKEEKDYEILDEIPFWANGEGFINGKRTYLFLFDDKNGKIERLVLPDLDASVEHFALSPDKKQLIIITNHFRNKMKLTNELGLFDLDKRTFTQISKTDHMRHYYADFLQNNKVIYTAAKMNCFGLNENEAFYLIHDTKKLDDVSSAPMDLSLTNSVGSDSRYGASSLMQVYDGKLYFVTTEGTSSHLNRLDDMLKRTRLTSSEGSVDGITVQDTIVFIAMRGNKLGEIYELSQCRELQLTRHNEWLEAERTVCTPEPFAVTMGDGVTLEGFVLKPAAYEAGRKYPGILTIHGGPKTVYGSVYYHELQYFANEGYFVFYCNPRGSDGRGDEFADLRGKYGTVDYEDLMKFTDEVLNAFPSIDDKKLGVMGGSYGGFMTNWIIGHTNRFRAAVSQRSISNWISEFNTTDIGYYFVEDQISATPWNDEAKLWEASPLKYAHLVQTPTLFIHSEEDYRCWLAEGIQMFTALKYHDIPSRLCMFRGENHELTRSGKPKHRIRNLKEVFGWMNQYLIKE